MLWFSRSKDNEVILKVVMKAEEGKHRGLTTRTCGRGLTEF